MIPLRDVIPSRTTPFVTVALIALNVLVFAYELSLGDAVNAFTFTFGLVPSAFSGMTVLTSMFVHGGFLHVAGNMLYLWIFGDNVEDRLGPFRFILLYLVDECGGLFGAARARQKSGVVAIHQIPQVGTILQIN